MCVESCRRVVRNKKRKKRKIEIENKMDFQRDILRGTKT